MYRRPIESELAARLARPRPPIQVVWGPRQTGKSTSVASVLAASKLPSRHAVADALAAHDGAWVLHQWEAARVLAEAGGAAILALDGVSEIAGWAADAFALSAEDAAASRDVRVVLVTPATHAVRAALSAHLAGAYESLRFTPWGFDECRAAFSWDLETYLFFGGYPGGAPLTTDVERWRAYMTESVIEPAISRDILLATRVDKPALLRALLAYACEHAGRVVAYSRMLPRLPGAGNTTTLANHLALLDGAGLVAGLPKFAGGEPRKRASSPKLQVHAPALLAALSGRSPEDARTDLAWRARLVRSAVGALLLARAAAGGFRVGYWREGEREVDFVVSAEDRLLALELKLSAGEEAERLRGMGVFLARYPEARPLVVSSETAALERFLAGEAGAAGLRALTALDTGV